MTTEDRIELPGAFLLSVGTKTDRHGDLVCRVAFEFEVPEDEEIDVARPSRRLLRSSVLITIAPPPPRPPAPRPLDVALEEAIRNGALELPDGVRSATIEVNGRQIPVDRDGVIGGGGE